eukprot:SAG22_NODE_625_length_8437_cov_5.263133_5_plen_45_part_00
MAANPDALFRKWGDGSDLGLGALESFYNNQELNAAYLSTAFEVP